MLRGRHRRSENGHIMWPVKKIITMLALLDATRDTIGIVMGLPRHSRITRHLKLPLTLDQICGIVQETLTAWPNFVLEAQSIHSHVRLHCQRQLNECRTQCGCSNKIKKGLPFFHDWPWSTTFVCGAVDLTQSWWRSTCPSSTMRCTTKNGTEISVSIGISTMQRWPWKRPLQKKI